MRLYSFIKNKASRRIGGFSLPEMMVVVLAGGIIMAGLVSTMVFVSRSFIAIGNYIDLDAASRHTLDMMSRDIRSAAAYSLSSYATNRIVLANQDGSSFAYSWDPATTALIRYYTNASGVGQQSQVMLTNCDILTFNIYQRNPTNNFQFISTTGNPGQTKLIDVSWRCSRQIYGVKINTESVQTARIAIRN